MTLSRRYLIRVTILFWLMLVQVVQAKPVHIKVLHVLNRLSYGIRAGDIDRVKSMGVDKYIQQQLNPDQIIEPIALTDRLAKLETINLTPVDLFYRYNPNRQLAGEQLTPEVRKVQQKQAGQVMNQAIEAKLIRSIYSDRQLQEVMIDFWYNHLNVYADKGIDKLWVGAYERDAIRPYTLGKFRDLLGATARHPAMLFYLDNWRNSAPNSNPKGRMGGGLNENYARELMELHTLGVDGGYQQSDVISLARIFTGWGFKQPGQKVPDGYSFQFNSKWHDFGNKTFLNQTIIGSGIGEGEQALDLLSRHPSTARQISIKLARYFVSDVPPKSLVDKLAKRFIDTDGDIKLVLDTLFKSSEFWNAKYYGKKFKTPYQYAISAMRSTGVDVNNIKPLNDFLKQLGMPIYGCPTPNGYKDTQDDWLNPDSLTRRLNFVTNLGEGRLQLSTSTKPASNLVPISIDPIQLATTLGNSLSPRTQQAIESSPPGIRAALILGSPEFMNR